MSESRGDERSHGSSPVDDLDDATVTRSGAVSITSEDDILEARQTVRTVAEESGFGLTDVTRIVTAVSELARNIFLYAEEGRMEYRVLTAAGEEGIELVFDDDGPGVENVDAALQGNHSTSDGMGRGLVGTRELMDEFHIETSASEGTTITIRKWHR
ncbi:anti-sigma regulatory factor [Halovenus marina]|uniref:anti-sigma regulatory factor n=1 Tax=Halovenus marina TaxID=3396621 RepID=UPI003F558213